MYSVNINGYLQYCKESVCSQPKRWVQGQVRQDQPGSTDSVATAVVKRRDAAIVGRRSETSQGEVDGTLLEYGIFGGNTVQILFPESITVVFSFKKHPVRQNMRD